MAHGQPDFGMYQAKATIGSMADNAELAARLGSIVTFDRRGDVVWFDDFEDNIAKWTAVGNAALSADTARNGGLSGKLVTGVLVNDQVSIERHLSYPVLSGVGFEMSLCHYEAGVARYEWRLVLYNPDLSTRRMEWRYYPATTDLQILDQAAGWQSLGLNIRLGRTFGLFHTFKMVADYLTNRYVRLIWDETTYDLSAYEMPLGGHAGDPYMSARFIIVTAVAFARTCYVDDAIFTQNEP